VTLPDLTALPAGAPGASSLCLIKVDSPAAQRSSSNIDFIAQFFAQRRAAPHCNMLQRNTCEILLLDRRIESLRPHLMLERGCRTSG
jgi:hypothetical protein